MKKVLAIVAGLSVAQFLNAQEVSDALRYSIEKINGTARFSSMSGAFTALGGDMSAVSINPAGSAIFNASFASVSFGNVDRENEATFFNGFTSSSASRFDLQQGGGVFVFNSTDGAPMNKIAVGFNYDQTGNYNDFWQARGINSRSIDQFFLNNANGLPLGEISAFDDESLNEAYQNIGDTYGYRHQQAFLGFESYIIDPLVDSDENTAYMSSIAPGTFDQAYTHSANGYNGKFAVNFATAFNDKFYVGINLNWHVINYESVVYLNEYNDNAGSFINEVDFENRLYTIGQGFSFQIGGILKLTEELRAGISYTSPTWYNLQDETLQYIRTYSYDNDSAPWITINSRISNIFPEYRLKTPSNLSAGLAYVFGNSGLISFDYVRKNYSNMEYRPTNDPFFQDQNDIIENKFKAASTYRIGAEYKVKGWSFRGGYRFEEGMSTDNSYGDLSGYSLGLGYSFGNFKIDGAFVQAQRTTAYQLFSVGLVDRAKVDTRDTLLNLTLGFSI